MLKVALSLRWLRWVLLALYLTLILGLGGTAFFEAGEAFAVALLVFTFSTQASSCSARAGPNSPAPYAGGAWFYRRQWLA